MMRRHCGKVTSVPGKLLFPPTCRHTHHTLSRPLMSTMACRSFHFQPTRRPNQLPAPSALPVWSPRSIQDRNVTTPYASCVCRRACLNCNQSIIHAPPCLANTTANIYSFPLVAGPTEPQQLVTER